MKMTNEKICPYSKNNRCLACHILSIFCEGDRYWRCEQYRITNEREQTVAVSEEQYLKRG